MSARGRVAVAIAFLAGALLVALLALPLAALVSRVPPGALVARLGEPAVLDALRLSLLTTAAATVLVVLGGTPLAWLLASRSFAGKRALEVLVDLPMVLPPTVAGLALLLAFGRAGLAGRALETFGVALPFSTAAVVIAQAFMAAPFFVGAARAGFASVPRSMLDAAATLRADELTTFVRIVLPLARPALVAGVAMAAARALGEFGATIMFAGNLPGVTQTMPLAVYVALQSDAEVAIALSILLLAGSFALLLALRAGVRVPALGPADARRETR